MNMGLTCYANAVIQCMRNCKRVPWLLEKGRCDTLFVKEGGPAPLKPRRKRQQDFVEAFADVLQLLGQCGPGQSVRPAKFWTCVNPLVEDTMYEHLASKAPHDSHEFYLFLLESLHESTSAEVDMRITRPGPVTPQEKLVRGALEAWIREFSKEYSPFVDLFYGLGHWRTICQRCKTVSHRWESFNSLKVSVPPRAAFGSGETPTISSLLEAEKKGELIADYDCETCKSRTEAERLYSIWRLPATLVLVLKRFTADGRKIHTQVAALEDEQLDFAPFFSEESPEKSGATKYKLRSIVDHHGSSAGGHYNAQVNVEDKWLLFDDEGVITMPSGAPAYGSSTYMLFLERAGVAAAPAT